MCTVDIFAEDGAHEALLKAVVQRAMSEHGVSAHVRVVTSTGGHGRVRQELVEYQKIAHRQAAPALIVVGIDGNCQGFRTVSAEIAGLVEPALRTRTVIACPDPHIERWYLADTIAFQTAVGVRPKLPRRKCGRDMYKKLLAELVIKQGHPATLGGIEFAEEIVQSVDWYRFGKADTAFKTFWRQLQAGVTSLQDCQ
jgi:hypothetical protein